MSFDPDRLDPGRLAAYAQTVLEIGPPPALVVDVREPVGPAIAARLAGCGLPGSFAVITAHNPLGRTFSAEDNEARTGRLLASLDERHIAHVPADGRSPDGSHREAGVAVAVPQAEAAKIARHAGQDAFFWFDGKRFWIVGALRSLPPTPLPL